MQVGSKTLFLLLSTFVWLPDVKGSCPSHQGREKTSLEKRGGGGSDSGCYSFSHNYESVKWLHFERLSLLLEIHQFSTGRRAENDWWRRIDGTEGRERDLGVVGNFLFPRCVVPEWREQIRRSLTTSQVLEMLWSVGFGCMFVVGHNGNKKIYLSNDKYTTLEKHCASFPNYLWKKDMLYPWNVWTSKWC